MDNYLNLEDEIDNLFADSDINDLGLNGFLSQVPSNQNLTDMVNPNDSIQSLQFPDLDDHDSNTDESDHTIDEPTKESSDTESIFDQPSFRRITPPHTKLNRKYRSSITHPLPLETNRPDWGSIQSFEHYFQKSCNYKKLKHNPSKIINLLNYQASDVLGFEAPDSELMLHLLDTSDDYFKKTDAHPQAYSRNSCYDLLTLGVLMEEYVDYLMENNSKPN